jgi:predicted Zn-dependent protease
MPIKMKYPIFYLLLSIALISSSCSKDSAGNYVVNAYSVDDDKNLGNKLVQQIASDPAHFPVLDSSRYPVAYANIHRIVNTILNGGKVAHRNDFQWVIRIIHDDSTLNAFCGPGGKIYVYSGIIKYLDNEDQLAGVLGHEIAHADQRHVTQEMTKEYGLSVLQGLLGTDSSRLAQVAQGLLTLKFSRANEAEADKYSVIYLCPTEYKSDGAAGFFTKLLAHKQNGQTPVFLSDHPSDTSRIQAIENEAATLKCSGTGTFETRYADFKRSLP